MHDEGLVCGKGPIVNGAFAERDLSWMAELRQDMYDEWFIRRKRRVINGSSAERCMIYGSFAERDESMVYSRKETYDGYDSKVSTH